MISGHLFEVPGAASAEWTFVVGQNFIVAVPAAEAGSLDSFDTLVDRAGASVESLVAAMPAPNAEGSFAIVAEITPSGSDEASVTVVVRGDTAVDIFSVGGWRRVTDRGIRPWMLADFQSTTAVVIGRPSEPLEEIDRLDRTVVPDCSRPFSAGRLAWSVRADSTKAGQAEAANDDSESEMGFVPGWAPAPEAIDDQTVIVDRRRRSPWTPPPVPLASTPRQTLSAVYRFQVGDQEVSLTEISYIGRNPQPPRIRSAAGFQLVTVESATREVSGTHLKLEQVGNTVVATDLASANGTVAHVPGAAPMRLRPAVSVVVGPGTRLEIGDGNIVEILKIVSASPDARGRAVRMNRPITDHA